jgi:exodeoxyribonuclease VII small subunit
MAVEKFETALKKLEEAVRKLESGELTLDDSLKAYEEGVKLAAFCSRKLNDAEKRVEVLTRMKDGTFSRGPFQLDET